MRFVSHLIFLFITNLVAIFLCQYFVLGFKITGDYIEIFKITACLTIINLILKPVLKFILSPIIVLTFGLFTFVINALILLALDIIFQSLSIVGIRDLIYATIVIGLINFVVNFSAHNIFKKSI